MQKSSFKKKETTIVKDANYLFFGLSDLDYLFNNQYMRGTITLIEEDSPTRHYLSFLRYFVGCGIHLNQKVFIYDILPGKWKTLVPTVQPQKTESQQLEENKQAQEKAKIAWRYDEMNIKLKEKNSNKDIPALDLSKNVDIESNEFVAKGLLKLIHPKDIKSYKDLMNNIFTTLQESLSDSNDKTVKRFVFPSFFTSFCALNQDSPEVIKFFNTLRVFARSTYACFVFTVNAENLKFKNQLRFIFDYVLSLETLKDNTEFEDFQGFLRFTKVPSLNKFLTYPRETEIYGFKANKKELEIDKLYLNPEKETTDFAGAKHEGSLICSTKPSAGAKLDF